MKEAVAFIVAAHASSDTVCTISFGSVCARRL
jgi:hypothetical protein